MLDRETVSKHGKTPKDFRSVQSYFLDCLEKTKVIVKNDPNGEFKECESCIDKAMELIA